SPVPSDLVCPGPAAARPLPPSPTRRPSDLRDRRRAGREPAMNGPALAPAVRAADGAHPRSSWNPAPVLIVDPDPVSRRFVELARSEEHTSELQSRGHLVCRLLLEKKKPKPPEPSRTCGRRIARLPRTPHSSDARPRAPPPRSIHPRATSRPSPSRST